MNFVTAILALLPAISHACITPTITSSTLPSPFIITPLIVDSTDQGWNLELNPSPPSPTKFPSKPLITKTGPPPQFTLTNGTIYYQGIPAQTSNSNQPDPPILYGWVFSGNSPLKDLPPWYTAYECDPSDNPILTLQLDNAQGFAIGGQPDEGAQVYIKPDGDAEQVVGIQLRVDGGS